MNLKNISQEKADLAKSLLDIGLSEEDIKKGLDIQEDEEEVSVEESQDTDIEKSVEEQIAEKQVELDRLNELKELEKSEDNNLLGNVDEKFNDLQKSFTSQLEESNGKFDNRFDSLVTLVKSLTEKVSEQNESFTAIKEENSELKKSLNSAGETLSKLAAYTPGLQSHRNFSGANHVERFEKSTSNDNKEVLSVSKDKDKLSAMLASKMDNEEFRKSLGDDISSFEISSKVSPKLEKAINDELGISLTQ